MDDDGGVLYLVVSGAPAPEGIPALVAACQAAGWQVVVFSTPTGIRFIDPAELERLTGEPVRCEYRMPGTGSPVPAADAVLACPLTFNSVNKFAHGHADNFAIGLLCEMAGYGVPVVVVPHCKPQLASHPAFGTSLETLRGMGVRVLFDPGRAVRAQAAAVERGRRRAPGPGWCRMTPSECEAAGQRIARARRRRGLSQAVLAGLVGRSESWLSQVERGKRGVDSHSVLVRLAEVLREDIEEFTGAGDQDETGRRAYPAASLIEQAMTGYGTSGPPGQDAILQPPKPEIAPLGQDPPARRRARHRTRGWRLTTADHHGGRAVRVPVITQGANRVRSGRPGERTRLNR